MPFALINEPSQSEISEAINYLLANFGSNIAADPNTGEISGPSGIVIAYLYRYLAVKYADSFDGSVNFGDSPTNRLYYGLRNSNSSVESTNYADYIWFKVAGGGFGTTNFLWYITSGGRQIQFFVGAASPALGYATVGTGSIDLDIITSSTGNISFLAYFQPASLQVVRSGNPLTPSFTGVQPRLYASAGGTLTTYVSASTDADAAFGNNTWRIGGSSTTGTGDITYNQITIGLPTDGGGFALWPAPTAMSGTPASLLVPVRYKNAAGVVSQANVAQIQLVFIDQGPTGDLIAYPSVYQWALSTPSISGTSTYTWATNLFTPDPASWTATPAASTPGYNLYRAQVTLSAPAGTATSTINWTTASIGSIGSAGSTGSSARICFTRMTSFSNPVPTSGNIATSGNASFPSSGQSLTTWGFSATWGATDPDPASTFTLYQADGIYDPASNTTNWSTPYISSLKVGSLSAISVNTGSLTISGTLQSNTASISGTTMTGSGGVLYSTGNFAFGNSAGNITYNGTDVTMNGAVNMSSLVASNTASAGYLNILNTNNILQVTRTTATLLPASYIYDTSTTGTSVPAFTVLNTTSSVNTNMVTMGGYAVNGITLEVSSNSSGSGAAKFFNNNASKQFWAAPGSYSAYSPSGGGKIYIVDGNGPFTGFHDTLTPIDAIVEIGDIMVDTQLIYKDNISSTLFEVAPSNQPNQSAAIGIASGIVPVTEGTPAALWVSTTEQTEYGTNSVWSMQSGFDPVVVESTYKVVQVNALGEGQINVCGENGNIAVGDLIVTSSTAGKGMKQADDIIRSYTVAKAREAVTFASPTEIKQVACIYVSG